MLPTLGSLGGFLTSEYRCFVTSKPGVSARTLGEERGVFMCRSIRDEREQEATPIHDDVLGLPGRTAAPDRPPGTTPM